MNLKIDTKEFGFIPSWVVAVYWKRGKWRVYEQSAYKFKGKNFRDNLIKEVSAAKRVRPDSVKIGTLPDFIDITVDILHIYKGKPKNIIYPKKC